MKMVFMMITLLNHKEKIIPFNRIMATRIAIVKEAGEDQKDQKIKKL